MKAGEIVVHLDRITATGPLYQAACNASIPNDWFTVHADQVTCHNCLGLLEAGRSTNHTRVIRSDWPLIRSLRRIWRRRGWQDCTEQRKAHRA